MKLGSIRFYPVKSTASHDVDEAEVQPWGLAGDRRYLITDQNGDILTAREEPALLACVAELDGDTLTLTGPHAAPLPVTPVAATSTPRSAAMSTVDVWGAPVELTDCGDDAARWLSELAGQPVRLKWLDDPTRRPVDPAYGRPEDRVSLADGYPLLLATSASLAQLNDWIAETALERGDEPPAPLPMHRFRPNVVIDGVGTPFAEDAWKRLRIGNVGFRVTKGCDRCVLTTIDTATYTKGKEPLRTLARHRKWDGKVWFGINLIPDGPGRIVVGDAVTIL
ncbi:MOSC domain-containing protein [Nonomuraea diastatica]|uniref:MOSC domain-containing protein n=1 Tax=Nonomuraea diastatica TaxID=1848329 RepID=A0A4R4WWG9_9ACTN|nr:MOSC N-terminal beta barrel domain-containing protein [Nonomuraea diastatica]TDD22096.1 MOSC domain-containing protein [Nonomuraea diastatica]